MTEVDDAGATTPRSHTLENPGPDDLHLIGVELKR
jgi:hypothetical protein